MALKDLLKSTFKYFEVDDDSDYNEQDEAYEMGNEAPTMRVAPTPQRREDPTADLYRPASAPRVDQPSREKSNLQRLNERQRELALNTGSGEQKTVIDIKFPKKYEEAPEIVDLLVANASVLIDFQFMSEVQARRCLDYLDGARSVLAGNLRKVSNTMWLLTPVNVMVNIEELRSANSGPVGDSHFDFDMKR